MKLAELSWPQIAAKAPDMPVVLPIAAIEQHGHHLPVNTDSMLLGEIVERISGPLHDQVLFAPLMWLGNSHHHLDFAGTLSASPRVYLDLLHDLIDNLLFHGFRRIVLLNGHGGNDTPGKQAIFEMRQRYRERRDLLLLMGTYWGFPSGDGKVPADLHQQEMGHACEWETSMVLRLAPHLVGDYRSTSPVEPGNPFRPATRAWTTRDRSQPGHIGWPHLATPEKGEALLQSFAAGVETWLRRVIAWDGSSWDG